MFESNYITPFFHSTTIETNNTRDPFKFFLYCLILLFSLIVMMIGGLFLLTFV